MARRVIAQDDDDVSLFPFLSIIASIIGVLTMMIAAATLSQMNQDDVKDAIARAIEVQQINKQIAAFESDADKLGLQLEKEQARLLKTASTRQTELVKSRAELDSLLKKLAAAKAEVQKKEKIQIVIPEVPAGERETVEDLQTQLKTVKDRLAQLQISLDKKKAPPEEAEVSILPSGSGLSYTPRFVECTSDSIVLHTETPPVTIRNAEIVKNKKFIALLEEVANDNKKTIVFVLRSDSLNTYRAVKKLCDANNVRNGKLPAAGDGRLDFSHFNKKN